MEASQASASQTRSSSGSVRPGGSRNTNPDKQISQIEKSVTHLLVATKQLLETLTQWSRGNSQEEEVSDVYVRLGYEFNLACRAFNAIGVETNDLGPVPDLLRSILEDTLSQPASPQALDNYLPRIRDIIINLLHGLKKKQGKLRSRPVKDGLNKPGVQPPRQASLPSVSGNDTSLEAALETTSTQTLPRSDSRLETLRFTDEPQSLATDTPRTTSINRNSITRPSQRGQSRQLPASDSAPSTSTSIVQDVPSISVPSDSAHLLPQTEMPFLNAPPPPPKQDALTALQRGPDLERRASRRFSAYQISKHLGPSPNGVPVIPPAQHSPIPNRGREVKESLTAVRSRASFQKKRSATRLQEISPGGSDAVTTPNRISEERDDVPPETFEKGPASEPQNESFGAYSPTLKTPDEYIGSEAVQPSLGATLNGPLSPFGDGLQQDEAPVPITQTDKLTANASEEDGVVRKLLVDTHGGPRYATTPSPTVLTNFDTTPPQGKELTLFLQYKSKIKKFVLGEGFEGLTMARLQLAFIEKFAWNTHNNGVDLPEIYVQDPVSGVRHELEDLSDVKDRCVLVLNVEVLDEVKKHFDEGIGGLKSTLESVRYLLDGQGSMLQRFSDRQLETSKEMARLSSTPAPHLNRAQTSDKSTIGAQSSSTSSLSEIQHLRRDIAVLRQTYSTMSTDFAATMTEIKAKAAIVKEAATAAVAPSYEGDAGRTHVNQGKKQLSTDSETLVNRVDDLTDVVEDLRKDVVTRGVRPLPRQLEDISKEIISTKRQLVKMKEFLKREKPVWTKIWEKELDQVCTERDDLTQQEELMSDLDGDLQDLTGVFKLCEEATKQQTLQAPGNVRNPSKQFEFETIADPLLVKDGLLGEVRALKVNHEDRLEAIERAEKLRVKELQGRGEGEFQREVKEFVEEGKLKKTGGMDEVERLRKVRDEKAMKENWERQQAREAEKEKKRQAEAAAKAAAEAAAKEQQTSAGNSHESDEPVNSTAPDPIASQDSIHDASHTHQVPISNVHEATTLPAGTHSSLQETKPILVSETNIKHESAPPQLPEVNFSTNDKDKNEEVKQTESEERKTASKDDSWWKPAIF